MNPQCLGDTGSKLFRLNQHGDEMAHRVYAGAFRHILPGIATRASGALLKHDDPQLIAEFRLSIAQFLGRACRGHIQAQSGLDADDKKIEYIRQAALDTLLAFRNPPTEPEIRRQEAESQGQHIDEKGTHVGKTGDRCQQTEKQGNQDF